MANKNKQRQKDYEHARKTIDAAEKRLRVLSQEECVKLLKSIGILEEDGQLRKDLRK